MHTNSDYATASSAAVLEPTGVHPRPLGEAMKQVVAALSKGQSGSRNVYGVVVYGKSHRRHRPNYLAATGAFFRAYLRGLQALSRITHVILTHPDEDRVRTLETRDVGDVRFFWGTASSTDIKEKVHPSPGIYIISSHLDAELLEDLQLPLLPEPLREIPLIIQVKNMTVPNEGEEATTIWSRWEDDTKTAIEKDSLQWRKQFASQYKSWTALQVAEESTSLATNRAAIASRWVAEKKIFGIDFEGQKRFPQFQFQDGRPIPAVSKVIEAFPEHATGWDLAYFFVTPNSNLGKRKPYELLKEDPDRVVSLAQAFAHPADVF
jgi:hypothetical protein